MASLVREHHVGNVKHSPSFIFTFWHLHRIMSVYQRLLLQFCTRIANEVCYMTSFASIQCAWTLNMLKIWVFFCFCQSIVCKESLKSIENDWWQINCEQTYKKTCSQIRILYPCLSRVGWKLIFTKHLELGNFNIIWSIKHDCHSRWVAQFDYI